MALLAVAWVIAAVVWEVSDRWWLGLIASVLLTTAAYRVSDWLDRRVAVKKSLASTAPDYRLVRH